MLPFLSLFFAFSVCAQGEGGVFTSSRLAALKTGEGGLGNNPSALNWFNDVRNKTAKLGVQQKLSLEDIQGSVYLNDDFVEGTIYYRSEPYGEFKVRYDAFNDEIELKRNGLAQIEAIHKNESISCLINNKRLVYKSFFNGKGNVVKGYLIQLNTDGEYALYERRMKIFKEGKQAKTSLQNSFPHRFQDKTELYGAKANGDLKIINQNKKGLVDFFGSENEKKIKAYIKENNIDLKKTTDLIRCVNYMNAS